jgi:hypothetical protein
MTGRCLRETASSPAPQWPTADDLAAAEEPRYVLLSRVLHGLRHLPAQREGNEIVAPKASSRWTVA